MSDRFPVITGVGIVAAPGFGMEEVWGAFGENKVGLKPLTLFQSPRYGQALVGEVEPDLKKLGAPARGSRTDQLGWLAARQAICDSGIQLSDCGDRTGVLLGSSVGGSFDSERFLIDLIKNKRMRPGPTRHHECVSLIEMIADDFGAFGPSMTISTACSSGALAIATAAEVIQSGEADVMLTGGADSLSRITWGGFHALLLVDAEGCRPFDARRAGMSLGEGAAVLVLEEENFARRRGAKILARLTGWGAGCDAYHATAPHPQGAGAIATMRAALERAGIEPAGIDYINAHGTGTKDNDLAEANAIKTVFGGRIPAVSSTKRFFGHALAASGAIEAAVCVEALRRQELPPNPGFAVIDPAIGIESVMKLRKAALTHVMSNSFGFGGNNAVLIFSRPEASPKTRGADFAAANIIGLGVISPGEVVEREIEAPLPPGKVSAHDCGAIADAALLSPNQRRRLSRLTQMALVAARRSYKADPARRLAVAIGTGYGCLEDAGAFIENMISKDEREPMPARFPNSVHNALAGQIAMDLGAHGLNSAPTVGEISFECALWQAVRQIATGEADCALAGAVDELNKYPLAIGKRWGMWDGRMRPGEGAVVASLGKQGASPSPLARVTAVRLGRYRRPFDAEREADWIAAAVDLSTVVIFLSGAKGWPALDPFYDLVAKALTRRAGREIEHRTYKERCGEFHSASALGFSTAVELVRQGSRGVLLYTLSPRGGKALCCVQP